MTRPRYRVKLQRGQGPRRGLMTHEGRRSPRLGVAQARQRTSFHASCALKGVQDVNSASGTEAHLAVDWPLAEDQLLNPVSEEVPDYQGTDSVS